VSQVVALSGTVIVPTYTLTPGSLAFGNQPRNVTSAPRAVIVNNTGAAPLRITNITLDGTHRNQFAQTNTCGPFPANLAAGASCTINVTFRPTTTGNKNARVTVRVAAPATNQSVTLTGTGQ
jgi:hypothetical protein